MVGITNSWRFVRKCNNLWNRFSQVVTKSSRTERTIIEWNTEVLEAAPRRKITLLDWNRWRGLCVYSKVHFETISRRMSQLVKISWQFSNTNFKKVIRGTAKVRAESIGNVYVWGRYRARFWDFELKSWFFVRLTSCEITVTSCDDLSKTNRYQVWALCGHLLDPPTFGMRPARLTMRCRHLQPSLNLPYATFLSQIHNLWNRNNLWNCNNLWQFHNLWQLSQVVNVDQKCCVREI